MKKKALSFINTFILTLIVSLCFSVFAEEKQQSHYAYLSDSKNEDLSDTFYRNNEFLKCEARNLCKKREVVDALNPLKEFAFFFRRETDDYIVPVFLKCNRTGTSMASMAEELVPLVNEEVLESGDCLDEEAVEENVNPAFVDDALKAIQSFENGCPKREDGQCVKELVDNVFDDLNNFTNPMNFFRSDQTFEAGCLSNLLTNAVTSIWETVKLLGYHLPTGIWNLGVSAFNKFLGRESDTSDALLTSSIMSEEMADAITSFDFAKVYSIMKKNFWDFWGNVKEYYFELLGCTEWEGAPYYSTCLKKMDWSCRTCSNMLNFGCGMISQLGAGAMLGILRGATRSLSMMTKVRRSEMGNPIRDLLPIEQVKEAAAKTYIANTLSKTRRGAKRASFRTARNVRPITNFVGRVKDELQYLSAIGNGFRSLVAATPGLMYYNGIFQKTKELSFKAFNRRQFKKIPDTPLKRAHAYALRLDNMKEKFDKLSIDYAKLRGPNFDPVLYRQLNKELFDEIEDQLKGTGVVVERLPNQRGLRLSKDGEVFDYEPNFKRLLREDSPDFVPLSTSADDLKHLMTDRDFLLSSNPAITQSPRSPSFLKQMQSEATTARGIFKVEPDSMDGYIYMANFSANTGNIPKVEDCSGKMNGVSLVRMQDITDYPDEEEKKKLLEEKRAEEAAAREAEKQAEEAARQAEEAARTEDTVAPPISE